MIDDDDFEDADDEHDDEPDYDEDPDVVDPEKCCLGSDCLNPHPYHLASECFDLEMAKAVMDGDTP